MKRDLDLIKKILIQVEALDKPAVNVPVEDVPQIVVNEHVYLCKQAGLLEAEIQRDSEGAAVICLMERLTWNGHEFLQLARNEALWTKAKSILAKKAITFSFEMLVEVLKQEGTKMLLGG